MRKLARESSSTAKNLFDGTAPLSILVLTIWVSKATIGDLFVSQYASKQLRKRFTTT